MPNPGEVNQRIGRIYQTVFLGALEANIPPFEAKFEVETEPEKTTFTGRNGNNYSFDFCGMYNHPMSRKEVFGECKGYSVGKNLLGDYRLFLAKAYVASVDNKRNQDDYFWFVTNVPFACAEGRGIKAFDFVRDVLNNANANEHMQNVLGHGSIDDDFVHRLVGNLGVFILTDSFLQKTEISYRVKPGDTLWDILKDLHGTNTDYNFGAYANEIAVRNQLDSPDHLIASRRIRLQWRGVKSPPTQELPAY